MLALYLWEFAINFYFKCSSVCLQKFRGYETHITFFFFTLKHWTNTHAWKCLITWIMSKGRKKGFMILIQTWQKKIRLKSKIISWWGVWLTSGKIEKICTFNFWGSWLYDFTLNFRFMVCIFSGGFPCHFYVGILKREKKIL